MEETSYTMCPSKYLESMVLGYSSFVINFPFKNTYDLGGKRNAKDSIVADLGKDSEQ